MPDTTRNILVIVKNNNLNKQLKRILTEYNYQIEWLQDLEPVLKHFSKRTYNLLLLSADVCKNSNVNFREILDIIAKDSPQTQSLLLVRDRNLPIITGAIDSGIYQYVRIPASDEELKIMIDKTLSSASEFGRSKLLKSDESVYRFEGFLGGSSLMQRVYHQIEQVAPTKIPVLLLGETGTGKDLAARAIHRLSPKREGEYKPVNLGALPSELVASELFGHEKGSFTGASHQRKGVFETASDGTVFLDEIESIDYKVQISLLRLLEEKRFTRLGGLRSQRTDARIIAASNEDLETLVDRGKFREDLFFRLDVFRIVLPPLRERVSDIHYMAEEFISKYNYELNKNIMRIKPECISALEEYDWPGNVRELKNVLQRAVLICENDEIGEEHLPKRINRHANDPSKITIEIGISLDEGEKILIQKTLAYVQNNRKKAAELLGITRRALYNKLHKHGIQ